MKFLLIIICPLIIALSPERANAAEAAIDLRIATASNFRHTMTALASRFEAETGQTVTPVFGSSGKHYAQIRNGAPFDAFFAADSERPQLLENEGFAVAGSRFTYAVGKLVLWSPRAGLVDNSGKVLRQGKFRHLAIANPKLAPYGRAAREILEEMDLWTGIQARLVRGENVAQAFQFVHSGNAELGFVAWSQVLQTTKPVAGSYWLAPQSSYQPIEQQAVLLKDTAAARAFMAFMRGDEATDLIKNDGYETP